MKAVAFITLGAFIVPLWLAGCSSNSAAPAAPIALHPSPPAPSASASSPVGQTVESIDFNYIASVNVAAGWPAGYFATLTATDSGVTPATATLDAMTVTLSSKTLVADGRTASITPSEPNPTSDPNNYEAGRESYTLTEPDAGTASCPTNALALSEHATFDSQPLTIAGYAPAHCTLAVTDGTTTIDVPITVAPSTTTGPGTYLLAAVSNLNNSSGEFVNSTVVSYSATITALAVDAAGNLYVCGILTYLSSYAPPVSVFAPWHLEPTKRRLPNAGLGTRERRRDRSRCE